MGCLSNPEDRRNFEPIMIATDRPQNTSHFIRQAVGKHEHEFRCVCVCGLCYWVLFPLTPHLKFIERQPEFRQNETQKGFSSPMASATRVDVKGLPPTHTHTWMGRRSVVWNEEDRLFHLWRRGISAKELLWMPLVGMDHCKVGRQCCGLFCFVLTWNVYLNFEVIIKLHDLRK